MDTCGGRLNKKDIQESAKMYNQLVDTIISCISRKPDVQEKRISDAMVGIVNKKDIKNITRIIIRDELANINNSMKISNPEIDKIYK